MDTLTHLAAGVVIGELAMGKKAGKKALAWGALAANMPDMDVAFRYFVSEADSALFHRGISHSLLFLAMLPPLLALFIQKIHGKDSNSFKKWWLLVFLAWFSHLFIDVFNSYGTGLFEPFSHVRFSYDSIGIFDFIFSIPLIIAALVSILSCKKKKITAICSMAGLSLSVLYLGFTIINKQKVEQLAKSELARQQIHYSRILSTPLPITNFIWTIIAEGENGFWKGFYCVIHDKTIYYDYIPKNHNLIDGINKSNDFNKLQRFTKGFYALRKSEHEGDVVLSDLRFSNLILTPTERASESGMEFKLHITPHNELTVHRAQPDRKVTVENLKQYFRKIFNRTNDAATPLLFPNDSVTER